MPSQDVCPSLRYSVETVIPWLHISLNFLSRWYIHARHSSFFCVPNGMAIFGRDPANGGVECKTGWKNPTFDQNLARLGNNTRYSYSYHGRGIGNHTESFEWYQWFQVTILFNARYLENGTRRLYLQWPTNRKSYMVFRTAPFSMTINNPQPSFQCHAIFWRWISHKRLKIQP